MKISLIDIALLALAAAPLPAQEWTRFRGPGGSGLGGPVAVPDRWTDADLDWKAALPGKGHSSPVVWGDRIFLTSAEEDGARRLVLCLRAADGSLAWSAPFASSTHRKHVRNSVASGTPAVDAERVYAALVRPEGVLLAALDHSGMERWRRDLGPF